MKPEKLRVSSSIHDELVLAQKKCSRYQAVLYLAGTNEHGVITTIKKLTRCGGCGYMPGVKDKTLTKAYLVLARKNLIPSAFVYISANEYDTPDFGGDAGGDLWSHRNVPFIWFTGASFSAICSTAKGWDTKDIGVTVVSDTWRPPLVVPQQNVEEVSNGNKNTRKKSTSVRARKGKSSSN